MSEYGPSPWSQPSPEPTPPQFQVPVPMQQYPAYTPNPAYPTGPIYPQAPWPVAAPPIRDKRRFAAGTLVAVALVTAIVCGFVGTVAGYALKDTTTTSATGLKPTPPASGLDIPSGAPSSTPSTSSPTIAGTALLAKIIPAPAGAHKFTLTNGVGGVLDLTANCKQFFSKTPTEAGRLTQEGFVVAAATDYTRIDGLQILTHLTEFASVDGATSYVSGQFANWGVDTAVTGSFTVPGGGKGYEKSALDALGNRRTIMYERVGTIVIGLDVFTPGSFNRSVDLTVMAAQVKATG